MATVAPATTRFGHECGSTVEEATAVLPESNYVATELPGDTSSVAPTSPAHEETDEESGKPVKKLRRS